MEKMQGEEKKIRESLEKNFKNLKAQGATLYCWSSGGADYAKEIAEKLGIVDIFTAFLPKPHMLLDNRNINNWNQSQGVTTQLKGRLYKG
ncbi:MAG: hypothetical protein AAGA60_27650 [Cyanobacteria bacterium P01_E01_bin.42]